MLMLYTIDQLSERNTFYSSYGGFMNSMDFEQHHVVIEIIDIEQKNDHKSVIANWLWRKIVSFLRPEQKTEGPIFTARGIWREERRGYVDDTDYSRKEERKLFVCFGVLTSTATEPPSKRLSKDETLYFGAISGNKITWKKTDGYEDIFSRDPMPLTEATEECVARLKRFPSVFMSVRIFD